MLEKIYLEITNACNLDCAFCHKTKRKKKLMSEEEFNILLEKIEGKARYLYFHLMGEPTLHPMLPSFIKSAKDKGFLPAITTNGSLLSNCKDEIINARPYKVSISLHAPESNAAFSVDGYFDTCINFARDIAEMGTFVALRLWNLGSGADNSDIISKLHEAFPANGVIFEEEAANVLAREFFLNGEKDLNGRTRRSPNAVPTRTDSATVCAIK